MKATDRKTTIQCGSFYVKIVGSKQGNGDFEVHVETDNGTIIIQEHQSYTRSRYDRNKNRKST